jgi:hypothetical protein
MDEGRFCPTPADFVLRHHPQTRLSRHYVWSAKRTAKYAGFLLDQAHVSIRSI